MDGKRGNFGGYPYLKRYIMRKLTVIFAAALLTLGCKDKAAEQARIQQERTLDSLKVAMEQQKKEAERQRIVDSMNAVAAQREAAARSVASRTTTTTTTTTTQRKGMSSTAKGALIGAGAGAITGAAVSKKKGEGAIIGGLAGAAVGAGTGAIIDGKKKKQ